MKIQSTKHINPQISTGGEEYVRFDNSPTYIPTTEGTISWNSQDKTLNIQPDVANCLLQVGQESWVRVVNKSTATIVDGKVVYISGAFGNRPKINLAKADTEATSYLIGVVTADILDNANGFVTTFGLVRGIDTSVFGAAGTLLYLSATTAGELTATRPVAPYHAQIVATTLDSQNNGSIFVHPIYGFEMDEIHDFKKQGSYANYQLIIRNQTSGYFENSNNVLINDTTRTIYSEGNGGTAADLNVACGTDKTVVLTETVWQDIDFPIVIRTTGANIPRISTIRGNLTCPQWSVNDYLVFEAHEMIHSWKEGSTCYWHVHITTAVQDATNRYINWEIEYNYANLSSTWQAANITQSSGDYLIPANTAADTHLLVPIYAFAFTTGKIGAHVKVRLKRIASTGTAPSVDPFCEMLQMHIEVDTLGSRQIGIK